jgi:hypothetical protein
LRHQAPELARPDHHDAVAGADPHLLPHFEGGRGRLGEDGRLVGQRIGHRVQVGRGKGEVLGEGTVPLRDAQDGPVLAVRRAAGPAGRAGAARGVDLAHDASAVELGPVR